MSKISESCKKYSIQDLGEISVLESFFQNSEVAHELQEAEKYRKFRYMLLIPIAGGVIGLILYLAHMGYWQVEVGENTGNYRPSTLVDGILPAIIAFFVVKGIITAIFHKKIEGAIKEKILSKLSKELYSKLLYDQSDKYAFGDLSVLVQSGLIKGYEDIDRVEDSIGFTIDEPYKHIAIQGYELETSRTTRDSKGRRHKTTTNHCYLLRAKFPDARIELQSDLLIKTDEADNISRSWPYALTGGFIGFFLGGMIGQGIVGVIALVLIGAISTVLFRRWYIGRKRVRLENVDFEKYFDVQCADQIGSRMIVTPAFMDRLVRLARSSKYHYELLYKADRFYIKWSVGSDYLEVNTWKNIRENVDTFIAWYAQMKEILTFVFDMRLMYYAKYQADTSRPDHIPLLFMKKFFFVFAVILMGLSVHTTSAAQNDMMCTMEYAPVCGSVQVQCITAPCNPVRQTFGNACVARAAQAINVTTGECVDQSVPPIVGGDSDIHGCKASAGYSWESRLNSCVRSWETRAMVLNIANTVAPCVGVAPMQCLQIQRGSKKELFYDTIAGFDYMPGYTYRVLVRRDRVENPPADASAYIYSLVKILSKKPSLADTKWRLTGYNATPVTDMATLEFTRNSLHAKFCNNMNAQYRLQGDKIIAPLMMRTEMYCMSPLMTMEDHFDLSRGDYTLSGSGLVISTAGGNRYTFTLAQ